MKLAMDTRSLDCIYDQLDTLMLKPQQSEKDSNLYILPEALGKGHIQRIHLRDGLEINWFDACFHETFRLEVDVQYPHLEFSYMMSGNGGWEVDGLARSYDLSSGMSTFVYMQDKKIYSELMSNMNIAHVEIRMDIRKLGRTLPELERLSEQSYFCKQTASASQIPLIVEQMKLCPYTGELQKLYLEGKAFELLALHLGGLEEEESYVQKSKLKKEDIRCLHHAKDVLTHSWAQPPSLLELARMVGLNDFKLKLGFKELFGTTVFGYVRGLRMNEAHRLLEQGKANVSEAALIVGYQNLSHFAQLFRKTYGYNPGELGKLQTESVKHQR